MVCVRKHNPGAKGIQFFGGDKLDCRLGADWHEHWRLDIAMGRMKYACAGTGLPADMCDFKRYWIHITSFPFISIAAYWLSCRISVKVFRKGGENYEQ
jgi:hypothetical protein